MKIHAVMVMLQTPYELLSQPLKIVMVVLHPSTMCNRPIPRIYKWESKYKIMPILIETQQTHNNNNSPTSQSFRLITRTIIHSTYYPYCITYIPMFFLQFFCIYFYYYSFIFLLVSVFFSNVMICNNLADNSP